MRRILLMPDGPASGGSTAPAKAPVRSRRQPNKDAATKETPEEEALHELLRSFGMDARSTPQRAELVRRICGKKTVGKGGDHASS
jgi:hypothetical protein